LIGKLIKAIRGRLFDSDRPKTAEPSENKSSPTLAAPSEPSPGLKKKRFPRPKPEGTESTRKTDIDTSSREKPNELAVAWHPGLFEVPEEAGKTRFHDLGLPDPVMHAIADTGFQYCTPIQAEIMPSTLTGRDAFGRAQTGTG
jgi:ATP-dependent RNA helicase RhlB